MNPPTVSVVMCVYNGERYLAEAIESILAQTMRDFEFVIVDDGSTDGTGEVLRRYASADDRVCVVTRPHEGVAAALNFGSGLARGKYIARMDADDVAFPDRLAKQVAFLERSPEVAVVGGALEVVDDQGRATHVKVNPQEDAEIKERLLHEDCIAHPSVMLRTEVFRAAGGYRTTFAHAEDYDLWLRLAETCRFANLPDVLIRYRVHPESVSVRSRRDQIVYALGAQLSARLRRETGDDPVGSVDRITDSTLFAWGLTQRLGITEANFHAMMAEEYVKAARRADWAGHGAQALAILAEGVEYGRDTRAERGVVAATLWEMAYVYMRQRRWLRASATAAEACLTDPPSSRRLLQRARRAVQE